MTEPTDLSGDRMAIAVDRLTRTARLLGWTVMAAVCCFLLWIVVGVAAQADDPKAAARAIGQAGTAAARAIARNAGSTATVPGYAGTDVPERSLTASGMEGAARARLADPDDPGGKAGRAVIEGILIRPDRPVAANDPVAIRSEGIAASPQSPSHGADSLASGTVAECGVGLDDAEDGGSCGSVRYCVGAGCESVQPRSNTGFANATTRLNMAIELGGEKFDRDDMRFFTGKRRACTIRLFGLADCCRNDGLLEGLAGCSASERELARERHDGNTHYLGKRCAKKTFFGACIRREKVWCTFGSKLGRILQEQGRRQLGRGWGDCRGFTVAEIEGIDFDSLDLSEFTGNMLDGSMDPAVSLPDAGDTGAAMRARVRDFYSRGR